MSHLSTVEPVEGDPVLHRHVYETLRHRLVTGAIRPDETFSTRGLATELSVSQMPIREALHRLAAEGAIEIRAKRRLAIPAMTSQRFEDLLACRLLLEPAAGVASIGQVDAARLKRLRAIDARMDRALEEGDVSTYMESNHAFHFTIYEASARPTLLRLIETLWLQFGPFMRVVYGRYGTSNLVDQHQRALAAIVADDAAELASALHSDIADGMGLIGRSIWAGNEAA